jgi:hypothetical protein
MLRSHKFTHYLFHGITVQIKLAERKDGAWVYQYGLIETGKDIGGGMGVNPDVSTLDEARRMVMQHVEDYIERLLTKRWIESTVQSILPDIDPE